MGGLVAPVYLACGVSFVVPLTLARLGAHECTVSLAPWRSFTVFVCVERGGGCGVLGVLCMCGVHGSLAPAHCVGVYVCVCVCVCVCAVSLVCCVCEVSMAPWPLFAMLVRVRGCVPRASLALVFCGGLFSHLWCLWPLGFLFFFALALVLPLFSSSFFCVFFVLTAPPPFFVKKKRGKRKKIKSF